MDKNYCKIFIVRHGQTDWNANQKIQGHTDIPLNKVGEEQARNLAQLFKHINFDAVYSSDLIRAKKTAELILVEKKLTLETTKLLRERRHGKLEGKHFSEMDSINKIWAGLDRQQRLSYTPYRGYESDGKIISRLITFLREIAVSRLGQTVLVVAHGGIMRVLLNHLTENTYGSGAVKNLAYIKLKSDGVDFFIEELSNIEDPND